MISLIELKDFLIISIVLSTITCAFIQKTKVYFRLKKYIVAYSFLVNMIFSILFCISFTSIPFPKSLWTGFFSFLGADTIYKSLEGRLPTYTELRKLKEERLNTKSNSYHNISNTSHRT